MKRNPKFTEVLKVGQLNETGEELVEIYAMYVEPNSFLRLKNMHLEVDDHSAPGVCWIDRCDLNGDMLEDAPLAVSAYHGQWLLKEIFRVPKRYWGKVRLYEPASANTSATEAEG